MSLEKKQTTPRTRAKPSLPVQKIREQHERDGAVSYGFTRTPELADFLRLIIHYQDLQKLFHQRAIEIKKSMSVAEKRALKASGGIKLSAEEQREITDVVHHIKTRFEQLPPMRSILRASTREKDVGHGQDSLVYSQSKKDKYVYKYSHLKGTPERLAFVRKKYELLKQFLPEHILQSAFVIGERKNDFDPKELIKYEPLRDSIITIQRRVAGKTFSAMSKKEKDDPVVLEALRKAHQRYIMLKKLLNYACQQCGVPPKTLEAKLDVGQLSAADETSFSLEKAKDFKSPNVMYDTARQQVYFIDYGMDTWDEGKEKVMQYILSEDFKLTADQVLSLSSL